MMVALADKPLLGALQDLRRNAATKAQKSPFYHWMLSAGAQPRQFSVKMIDPWPGEPEIARALCKGLFTADGASIPFAHDLWLEAENYPQWKTTLHSFTWLRHLRALGGEQSRMLARLLVDQWILHHDRWDSETWVPAVLGQRIAAWLTAYDFFCGSANESFQERYFGSLMRQTRHLARIFPADLHGLDKLQAAKGLIFAGLAFRDKESWAIQGFDALLGELPKQILSDGGHVSRSPQVLAQAVQILLDVRCALHRSALPVPQPLSAALEASGRALRFFRYSDKRLALFHGGQTGDVKLLDALQAQLPSIGRIEPGLRDSGYQRVAMGRSMLMLDTGAAPDAPHDARHHAAPLAFEFGYGRDRIFSNCGSHPSHPDWQYVLRHTAAHNALTINGVPAHGPHARGSALYTPVPVICARTETRETCLLDASHEFYARAGINHRRRFYLSRLGQDLRGEDTLNAGRAPAQPRQVDLRFHLDPKVHGSLTKDGKEARLALPGGTSWAFFAVGAKLSLESSISFASGNRPVKTMQLVVSAPFTEKILQVKWALQRI